MSDGHFVPRDDEQVFRVGTEEAYISASRTSL